MISKLQKKALIDIIKISLLFIFIGLFVIWFNSIFNRSSCIIYNVSGIPCPSCGFATAWYNIFKGNIRKAFYYNPMFFTVFLIYIPSILNFFNIHIKKKWITNYFLTLIILLILVWLVRLYLYFPYEPMLFNENSLIR